MYVTLDSPKILKFFLGISYFGAYALKIKQMETI